MRQGEALYSPEWEVTRVKEDFGAETDMRLVVSQPSKDGCMTGAERLPRGTRGAEKLS